MSRIDVARHDGEEANVGKRSGGARGIAEPRFVEGPIFDSVHPKPSARQAAACSAEDVISCIDVFDILGQRISGVAEQEGGNIPHVLDGDELVLGRARASAHSGRSRRPPRPPGEIRGRSHSAML